MVNYLTGESIVHDAMPCQKHPPLMQFPVVWKVPRLPFGDAGENPSRKEIYSKSVELLGLLVRQQ
jgi:hypothetical protein